MGSQKAFLHYILVDILQKYFFSAQLTKTLIVLEIQSTIGSETFLIPEFSYVQFSIEKYMNNKTTCFYLRFYVDLAE
jgi:hypothetical protein